MSNFFQRSFFILDSDTKRKLPLLLGIFLFSSCLDVVGLGMISAFLLLVVQFSEVIHKLPESIQHIFAHYNQHEIIFLIGMCLILVFIFKAFFAIYTQRKIVSTTARFVMYCKARLLKDYQNVSYHFHLKQNSAYLLNRISLVDSFASSILSTSLNMCSSLIVTVGVISCIALMHPIVTLFLFVMLSLIVVLYEFFIKKTIIASGKIIAIFGGEIGKAILQSLGGLKEIRVLGKEQFFLEKIKENVFGLAKAQAIYGSLQLIPRYAAESLASIFLVTLILGAISIKMDPIKMIPALGVFAAACIRLLPTVSQLIGQWGQIRSAGYATRVLFEELDYLERNALHFPETNKRLLFSRFSLQDVSFGYENTKRNAIDRISMTLHRGQSIGLIGASGAGKSTLVSIMLGLLTPQSGNFLVDDQSISNLREWLNNFAYIPQSIFLLDDTLKRNVAMGTKDADIDEKKLQNAIEMAQLASVVSELPDGVDTMIGENGVRLSGGQRQRVALARAFYYEREIIVMDEATSSLDSETEREVIQSIKRLHGVKTLIVIAHRLSTIQYCDIVYKLEKGCMVSQGSFKEVVG